SSVEALEELRRIEARRDAARLRATADDPIVTIEARGASIRVPEEDHRVAGAGRLHKDVPGDAIGRGVRFLRFHRGGCRSADERGREGLTAGAAGVLVVPELNGRLA